MVHGHLSVAVHDIGLPGLDHRPVADDHRDVAVLDREVAGAQCAAMNRHIDVLVPGLAVEYSVRLRDRPPG